MSKEHPLSDKEMLARVAKLVASGENPNGHYISAETLFKVIKQVEGVSEQTRRIVELAITNLVGKTGLIDSLELGIAMGQLSNESRDHDGLRRLFKDMKDLDKVPVVNIRGEFVS